MDVRKIELMRSLQKEYYGEKKRHHSARTHIQFLYRLVVLFLLAIIALVIFFK